MEEFETKADPPTAQAGAAATLGKIPEGATILVSGINDGIANAMFQAVKQAKREKDTLVLSIGSVNPGGLQFICQNPEYVGGLGFFPEDWPKHMIPALIARVQGVELEHKYVVPTEIIARDKINEFYPDFKCDRYTMSNQSNNSVPSADPTPEGTEFALELRGIVKHFCGAFQ